MDWLWQIFDPAYIGAFFTQFKNEMATPTFWVAVGKIIWINVLLSGDNALVIALACRGLAPRQRLWGMILGAAAAVLLRVIFTGIVASLMELPYLKLVGGLALIVIAAKLLVPEQEDEDGVQAASHLWAAVQVVVHGLQQGDGREHPAVVERASRSPSCRASCSAARNARFAAAAWSALWCACALRTRKVSRRRWFWSVLGTCRKCTVRRPTSRSAVRREPARTRASRARSSGSRHPS